MNDAIEGGLLTFDRGVDVARTAVATNCARVFADRGVIVVPAEEFAGFVEAVMHGGYDGCTTARDPLQK